MPDQPTQARCTRCGLTTTMPALLVWTHVSPKKSYCPPCAERQAFRNHLILRGSLIFWVLVFCLGADDQLHVLKFALVLLGVWIIGNSMLLLLHELSHAAVGSLVGLRIFKVGLGYGRPLWTFTARRTEYALARTLAGGSCIMAPLSAHGARWRIFIAIAAGPMVHIVLIPMVVLFGALTHVAWRNPTRIGEFIALELIAMNLMLLVSNVRPRSIQRDGQQILSDGAQLLLLLRQPQPRIQQFLLTGCSQEIELARQAHDLPGQQKWIEKARTFGAKQLLLDQFQWSILMQQRSWRELQDFCTLAAARSQDLAWSFYISHAWSHVMLDEPGGIDQAAQLAAAYRAILPWDYALDLLQAEISVMNGQLESADESLRRATRNNPPLLFRTEVACVQAQLALRRGNRPKAESLLAWARRYDDHCMLADRAARELRICQKITLSIDSVR